MREAMLRVIRIAAQTLQDADRLLAAAIAEARAHGATWREIGDAADADERTVRKRYGRRRAG